MVLEEDFEAMLEGPEETLDPVSDAYHRTRRRFVFFSVLLIVWEYIDIRIGAEGFDPVIEVVPIVCLVMLLYSGFRFGVVWSQRDSHGSRRSASGADLVAVYALAVIAVVVYAVQQVSGFRLANTFAPRYVVYLAAGLSFGTALATVSNAIARRLANRAVNAHVPGLHPVRVYHRHYTGGFAISAGVILVVGAATIFATPLDTVLLLLAVGGAVAALLYSVVQDQIRWRRASRTVDSASGVS